MKEKKIKKTVREGYARIAKGGSSCCTPVNLCCGNTGLAEAISRRIGYTEKELEEVPQGANLGLGCGNPVALASLKEGETVLDLGSGAGFDCFLAANKVGHKGKVIGVDMARDDWKGKSKCPQRQLQKMGSSDWEKMKICRLLMVLSI